MNIIPKNNPAEFEKFLFTEIDLSQYEYKFLNDYIEGAKNGTKKLFDKSLLNRTSDGWILILHGEILMIYGDNWNKNQFEEIKKIINLNQFSNFIITGNFELILELIAFFGVTNYSLYKERILYKTNSINSFHNNQLKIELGSVKDLNALAPMLQQYYHEEYKGLNDKSIVEMHERVFQLILTNKIYVLKNLNDEILSFCTIIDPA